MQRSCHAPIGANAVAAISGLKLVDAKLFRGATISLNQAAALLGELGISVV